MHSTGEPYAALQRERNRVSILLALSRHHIPGSRFRSLLRLQQAADWYLRTGHPGLSYRRLWIGHLQRRLDAVFEELEQGRFNPSRIHEIVHHYQHLFLGDPPARGPGAPLT